MFTVTILDNDDATIWFHRDTKIVHHQLKRYIHGPPFRAVLEAGAVVIDKEHATKWLSDDRNSGALSPADEEWAKNVWFPRVKRAGWKHWAIVRPEKVVGVMNIKRFKETYAKAGLNAEIFDNVETALRWLERQ